MHVKVLKTRTNALEVASPLFVLKRTRITPSVVLIS